MAGLLGCEGGRLDGCCGSWSDMAFEDFGFAPECELPSYLAFFRLQTIFRDIRRNTMGFYIKLVERAIGDYTWGNQMCVEILPFFRELDMRRSVCYQNGSTGRVDEGRDDGW